MPPMPPAVRRVHPPRRLVPDCIARAAGGAHTRRRPPSWMGGIDLAAPDTGWKLVIVSIVVKTVQ